MQRVCGRVLVCLIAFTTNASSLPLSPEASAFLQVWPSSNRVQQRGKRTHVRMLCEKSWQESAQQTILSQKLYAKVWLLFQSSGAAKVCLFGRCRALHLNYCRLACSIISILFDEICLHFLLKFMDWNNSKHSQATGSLSIKKCQGNLQTSVPGNKAWDEYGWICNYIPSWKIYVRTSIVNVDFDQGV